jgi:uncharacterized protein YbjT (DUF2867 family)
MKIILTGSLGNISQPLAQLLVQQSHAVTVISSKADKQPAIEALGATAAIGSVEDAAFLSTVFTGADAVYAMIPPNFAEPDARAYYQRIGRSYTSAIGQAGVRRVVHLSSWGADLPAGTGFIVGSYEVEQLLNALPDVAITHLRAGYLYYNLNAFKDMIKQAGIIGANYGGDDLLVMVSPRDIATAAAEELTSPAPTQPICYVASDERTAADTARVLGTAIGRPDLQWLTFTNEQMRSGLEQRGLPPHAIAGLVELGASIHSGALRRDYEQHRPATLGTVKLEDFAQEFAAGF